MLPFIARRLLRRARGLFGLATPWWVPRTVVWELTYACPLRCEHCYSESGRRPSRELPLDDLMRIADALLAVRPVPRIVFSGGEPLLVKGALDVAERLRRGGARVALYTSGHGLDASSARRALACFTRIGVSIDGSHAELNDALRGRRGAFEWAIEALGRLDALAREPRSHRSARAHFGIEYTVVRSNHDDLERFCRDVAARFSALDYVTFGAVMPEGFASRAGYAERELLTDAQVAALHRRRRSLQRLVPRGTRVVVQDNLAYEMRPDQIARARAADHQLKLEPDGRVRAIDTYEGTIGNLLDEPLEVLWKRARARHADPFVVAELAKIRSIDDWARATRAIDARFADEDDRARVLAHSQSSGTARSSTQ